MAEEDWCNLSAFKQIQQQACSEGSNPSNLESCYVMRTRRNLLSKCKVVLVLRIMQLLPKALSLLLSICFSLLSGGEQL